MSGFDLVVRNARVATASDVFDGRHRRHRRPCRRSSGSACQAVRREIDAAGRVVTPGGVDAHCHLDQPMAPPARMADDFDSGTRSAACGGTTTVIPFAAQAKGQSLRAAVVDYHQRAEGRAHVDYAFHLIVSDPTPQVLNEELPALIREGYTSFKIYMTYDDLKLDDGQILDVLAVARAARRDGDDPRRERRLHRVADQAARGRRPHRAALSCRVAADAGRARGDAPRDRAGRTGRRADPDRARLGPRGGRADPLGARAWAEGLCRDLPAVPVPDRRRPRPRRQLPRRHAASAARRRATARTSR